MKKIYLILLLFFIGQTSLFSQSARSTESERLTQQVNSLYRERKFPEAVALAEKVVELERKSLHKNWRSLADAILTLAFIETEGFDLLRKEVAEKGHTDDKNWIKYVSTIEPLFREAIDLYKNKLKDESLLLAKAEFELASFLTKSDEKFPTIRYYKMKDVEEFYGQAIAIRTKLLGEDDDVTMFTIYSAANFYRNNADAENSLLLYKKYLELVERKHGKTSEFLLPALNEAASVLTALKLDDEANRFLDRYKSISGEAPLPPVFDLTIREGDERIRKWEFDNPSLNYFGTQVTRAKWLMVHVELDEKGNVVDAQAEDPHEKTRGGKDAKKKAEKDIRKLRFRPVSYQGEFKKVRGVVWYPYSIKL